MKKSTVYSSIIIGIMIAITLGFLSSSLSNFVYLVTGITVRFSNQLFATITLVCGIASLIIAILFTAYNLKRLLWIILIIMGVSSLYRVVHYLILIFQFDADFANLIYSPYIANYVISILSVFAEYALILIFSIKAMSWNKKEESQNGNIEEPNIS